MELKAEFVKLNITIPATAQGQLIVQVNFLSAILRVLPVIPHVLPVLKPVHRAIFLVRRLDK